MLELINMSVMLDKTAITPIYCEASHDTRREKYLSFVTRCRVIFNSSHVDSNQEFGRM